MDEQFLRAIRDLQSLPRTTFSERLVLDNLIGFCSRVFSVVESDLRANMERHWFGGPPLVESDWLRLLYPEGPVIHRFDDYRSRVAV